MSKINLYRTGLNSSFPWWSYWLNTVLITSLLLESNSPMVLQMWLLFCRSSHLAWKKIQKVLLLHTSQCMMKNQINYLCLSRIRQGNVSDVIIMSHRNQWLFSISFLIIYVIVHKDHWGHGFTNVTAVLQIKSFSLKKNPKGFTVAYICLPGSAVCRQVNSIYDSYSFTHITPSLLPESRQIHLWVY
jgi:hypothetical protein